MSKSRVGWTAYIGIWLLVLGGTEARALLAQTEVPTVSAASEADSKKPPSDAASPVPAAPPTAPALPSELSDAERIARLQQRIKVDTTQLAEMQQQLKNPKGEYDQAQAEFQQLDQELSDKKKELEKLQAAQKKAQADALAAELKPLEKNWQLAKDRFQLAIDERKALQKKITTLTDKIAQDQLALDKLVGMPQPNSDPPPTDEAPAVGPFQAAAPAAAAKGKPSGEAAAPASSDATSSNPPAAAVTPPPANPQPSGNPLTAPVAPSKTLGLPLVERPASRELIEARQEAQAKEQVAAEAARDAESIDARIESLRNNLALERQLRENARKKVDNASETERTLGVQLQRRMVVGAPQSEIDELWKKINEAKHRYREALRENRQRTDRIEELQAQLANVQAENAVAHAVAEKRQGEAVAARERVTELENPLTVHNLLEWLKLHGIKLLVILLGMYLLNLFAVLFGRRLFKLLMGNGKGRHGRQSDRQNRANTLAEVFQSTATVVIIIGGSLMVLQEAGIDVTVLMGGVAVFGLAVAFGAQNLIKDYFTGFMILFENQYTLNDVVKIGDTSGQVEQITLRMTVLRDLEGSVHFIPNGQITFVTNMTHGWSRAVFDIRLAYKEDVDRVMDILTQIGQELRKDGNFSSMILDDPTMLGVDAIGDSAVVIKFYIKTRPLQQWSVKREMLRRIKNRFDELKIEIPFPQRTISFRNDAAAAFDKHARSA